MLFSFEYLDKCCGRRIVPVEIGSKYTDEDFSQILMPFHKYLKEFIAPEKVRLFYSFLF
jgi:lysine-specific demethylase 8